MPTPPDLSSMMPGFDFMQGLMKGAGAALPGMGTWMAPTLDPAELGKRIEELKTVQFWLEQNVRMIATTVQALEVQRMTLGTLKTLNVQIGDLAEAFTIRPSAPVPEPAPAAPPAASPAPAAKATHASAAAASQAPPPAQGMVDPMQWWGALTQQFTHLATQSLGEAAARGTAAAASGPAASSSARAAAKTARRSAAGAGAKAGSKVGSNHGPKPGAKGAGGAADAPSAPRSGPRGRGR